MMKKPFHIKLPGVWGGLALGPFSPRIDSRTVRLRLWLVACALVGVLAAAPWGAGAPRWLARPARAAGASPGLNLSPSLLSTFPSATFALDIVVDCSSHADALSIAVTFDPAYLQVVNLAPDASAFPLVLRKRYDNAAGRANYDAGAALECHVEGNCPSGTVHVATITFRAVGTETSVPLNVQGQITWEGEYIFDAQGIGSTIILTISGDVDGDCDVDIVDIMLVAAHWSSRLGQAQYDARYDLDADGDIDIVDIMVVAARWNRKCGGGASLSTEPNADSH